MYRFKTLASLCLTFVLAACSKKKPIQANSKAPTPLALAKQSSEEKRYEPESFPASSTHDLKVWKRILDQFSIRTDELQRKFNSELLASGMQDGNGERIVGLLKGCGFNSNDSITDEDTQKWLRTDCFQSSALHEFREASASVLAWDKVHLCKSPERWLSPVYRIKFDVNNLGSSSAMNFLGKRIRFISVSEYRPFEDIDTILLYMAIYQPSPLIEWAWSRRDITPVASWDILVQSILGGYKNNSRVFQGNDSERLTEMLSARSPTYRLLAISLLDNFETNPAAAIAACERASGEVNQIFWKTALEKLANIGGADALKAAEKFRLHEPVENDGTAFADDVDINEEVARLINAVK